MLNRAIKLNYTILCLIVILNETFFNYAHISAVTLGTINI